MAKPSLNTKKIADDLARAQVLTPESARQLSTLAGYSNRMVHFYFPREHRLRIRTNNALERIIREIRRRTRVEEHAYPDERSAF